MIDRLKSQPKRRPSSPDTLVRSSKKNDIELNEEELNRVSGGHGTVLTITASSSKRS